MIISCTFSKPSKNIEEILGRPYQRIKAQAANNSNKTLYYVEKFTKTQAFHEQKTEEELAEFIEKHAGKTFKNCIVRTESEEISYLGNKKGSVTKLSRKINREIQPGKKNILWKNCERQKNYLIPEGNPVPFMVLLGLMTSDGKVINSKYDKFRQINRFLEFINDILPEIQKQTENKTIRIADFGCGKSYLTFAVHYFLTEIKHLEAEIIGLDLKKDVIDYCNKIAAQLNLKGLKFDTGNIADYNYKNAPDIVITLHACDTATDFALNYAVKNGCKAILSVPCCQHELNSQLNKNSVPEEFKPLLKYGIIKERFAALATDALRGEFLESAGYSVQLLEFIDMEHTPKNILIRAVKKQKSGKNENPLESLVPAKKTDSLNAVQSPEKPLCSEKEISAAEKLIAALKISPTLKNLLEK